MSEPILKLRGIRREYVTGDRILEVLRGVDLDVHPGEIVGLTGQSGSGKSSLLHAAGLLERPTGGQVFLEGKDYSRLRDRARSLIRLESMGFVYQFHHLLVELSALDNVALPLMIAGKPRAQARERARQLLTDLGLADRLNHQPGQLSGGEQQRVAIGRSMANRPKVILADEPTGNLDPSTSMGVFRAFHQVAREEGVAALIATHNMELARYMDRVFALKEGKLVEQPREAAAPPV